MQSKSTPKANGFTIIEVLIVLALGSLIFMIIFLAVPTLNRNSRNNQRKQDVQLVLEAISHWELNNSGTLPDTTITPPEDYLKFSKNSLVYYQPANIAVHIQSNNQVLPNRAVDQPAQSGANAVDKVDIYNYEKCKTSHDGSAVITGAGYNDVVALYASEGANGNRGLCQEL